MVRYIDFPDELVLKFKLLGLISIEKSNTITVLDSKIMLNVRNFYGKILDRLPASEILTDRFDYLNVLGRMRKENKLSLGVARLGNYSNVIGSLIKSHKTKGYYYISDNCIYFINKLILQLDSKAYENIIALSCNGKNIIVCKASYKEFELSLYRSGEFVRSVSVLNDGNVSRYNDYCYFLSTQNDSIELLKEMDE